MQDPSCTLGVFTSGGTIANVTALWSARNTSLGPSLSPPCQGVEIEGIYGAMQAYGYRGFAVIGSKLLHYSLGKAVGALGLGRQSLKCVPYDQNFQVCVRVYVTYVSVYVCLYIYACVYVYVR